MPLLSADDPVFVVDLTEPTMDACREDLAGQASAPAPRPADGGAGEVEVRAVALVFAWEEDPVLLAIRPTRDSAMLDALARLLRMTMLTGNSIAALVTEHGDAAVKRLYFAKRFPRFIYEGFPATVRPRLPTAMVDAMGSARRRR